jgi:outer membrane lipoprotein LolB
LKRRPRGAPLRERPTCASRRRALAMLTVSLAGCATVRPPSVPPVAAAAGASFALAGRISARRGDAGIAGHFTWMHESGRDSIDLATPLGQTLARLTGDANGVDVRLQDGRTEHAADWNALTERAFGVTIPVSGLAAWVRGVPRPTTAFTDERDDAGRVSVLRQDGWEIVYAYPDPSAQRPSRLSLRYPGADAVDVRVVVDEWM